jgi:protein SCO1
MTQSSSPLSSDGYEGRTVPPRRRRLHLAVVVGLGFALAAAAGADLWLRSGARQIQATSPMPIGGPFSLVDPKGRPVTDRDFRGRYMLVYFGYTHCPDACPTTLIKIAGALQTLGPNGRQLQPIFITVDPAHDTPKVVGDYASHFSPRILGLSGSPTQIAAAEKAYRVYASPDATPAELDAAIDHSSVLYLMGRDGRFIAPVRLDGSPADMAADIAQYL